MFSYNEYRNIINLIKNNLPILDFTKVDKTTKKFCVLRHDIEFSIDRAHELAKVEKELGVTSTYTVQLRNNTYNALSEKNIGLIRKIKDLGHNIGLHQNPPLMDMEKKFFHYFDEKPNKVNVLYLADSNHEWKYGYPLDYDFSKINKLQLLTHPYSWTNIGGDNYGNFLSLIRERNNELVGSMNTETNTFPKELLR